MKFVRQNTFAFILAALTVLSSTSCAHKPAQQAEGPVYVGSGDMGPQAPPSAPVGPDAPVGPLPGPDYKPPKESVVLVLGPGLARGLSYIGVLSELEDRQMIVSAVVGVEVGAMIGGIWASSNTNTLEWETKKFKRSTLLDVPFLRFGRSSRMAEGKTIYKFLTDAVKVDKLQKMKVPLFVASATREGENSGGLIVEGSGSAPDIIRGAMGLSGILKTYSWEGKERMSAALENPFPAQYAKNLGLGTVVCVDVLGRGDNFTPRDSTEEELATIMRSSAAIARETLKNCDVVLQVATNGVGYLNFDAKAELIYQGRQAVRKWLEMQHQ